MYDAGANLVVLIFGDPHRLEGRQRRQNGPTDPHEVFAFGRRHDPSHHVGWSPGVDLLGETGLDSGEQGAAPRQNNIVIEDLVHALVTFEYAVDNEPVDTTFILPANKGRVKQDLRAAEALGADLYELTIW